MKKFILFFAIFITLFIPINVYADPVGGIGADGSNESVIESVEDAEDNFDNLPSESDNLTNGNDSVDYDNTDDPVDNFTSSNDYQYLDDMGRIIEGQFSVMFTDGEYLTTTEYVKHKITGSIKSDTGTPLYIYFYREGSTVYYNFCCSNSYFSIITSLSERFVTSSLDSSVYKYPVSPDLVGTGSYYNYQKFAYKIDACPFYLSTDIPIFDKDSDSFVADLDAYLQTGDVSGAVNSDSVSAAIGNYEGALAENSSDITVPVVNALETFDSNVTDVFKPRSGMSIMMSTPSYDECKDKDYVYDIQVGAQCTDSSGQGFTLNYKYFYCGEKVNIGSEGYIFDNQYLFNDVSTWVHSVDNLAYVNKLYVRLRYRVGKQASNWVQVVFNNGSPFTPAYEQDVNGGYVTDGRYDGSNLGGTVDSGYSPGGYLGDNVSYLLSTVQSGFGLLDGGLISLLANTFRYIPASIWDLFKTYISSVIIVLMIILTVRAVTSIASSIAGIFGKGGGS